MNEREPRDLMRRRFLLTAASLAGGTLSALALGNVLPCPPPAVDVTGGSSGSKSCTPGLPYFMMSSAAQSGTYGWTFGHAFRQGDVPSGVYLTSPGVNLQAIVRNTWPDGSVKYAVLSAITPFSTGQLKVIPMATTSTAPSGSIVPEPKTLPVVATFSGAVTGTYSAQSCLGVDLSTWNKGSAGRVRQILGPIMSEFHYYLPTSDAQVALWFFVRCYANGATEVETVVENGWLNVPNPGERDYSISLWPS